ncbi:MAG: hypothetical protein HOF66_06515 [Nitrosomonadaceae bacterium]|nr:hypothetical protein [Nitrosomonadaceae bacterium]
MTVLSFEASAKVACSPKSATPGAYVNTYWVADPPSPGNYRYWDEPANWSTSSGGSPGAKAPTDGCGIAIFDNGSVVNATIRPTIQKGYRIHFLKMGNGYTGTIDLNGKFLKVTKNIAIYGGTLLVPTGSVLQNWQDIHIYPGGTLNASDAKIISVKQNVHVKGVLTAPDGDNTRFVVHGGFNIYKTGTFNHNNGTVTLATQDRYSSCTAFQRRIHVVGGPAPGRNFYNLYRKARKPIYLADDIEVENDLTNIGRGCINATDDGGDGHNITIGGDLDIVESTGFKGSTGKKVIFNGSAQTIDSAAGFTDVQIFKGSDVSLIRNTTITGTLTIDSYATLDLNGYNLTAGTLVNNGTLQLQGGETVAITTMDTDTGTVTYDGTGTYTQLAAGDNYFNLTLNSSGSITLDANLDVNGNLNIIDGSLDVSTDNRSINVAGNWSNADTFISRSGTVTFDGTSDIVTGGTGDSNDFYDVTLSGTEATQSSAIAIDNDFEITSSGTWYKNCFAMTVSGDTTTGSGSIATTLAPSVLEFVPANSATGVAVSSDIVLKFNTVIRNTDDSDISSSDLDTLITLKATNSSGSNIAFSADIDTADKVITINPDSNFSSKQVIYVAISTGVENSCGTALGSVASAIFTAADIEGPTHTWSPENSDTGVAVNSNITLTFNEAVEQNNVAGTELTDSIVSESGFITLRETDVNGSDIAFAATIDSDKKIITINPTSDFSSEQVIYVAIGTPVKDSSGNVNTASSATFTVIDSNLPHPNI